MEPFAENRIEIDRTLYFEGVNAVTGRANRKRALCFLAIVAALLLAVSAVLIWQGGNLWFAIAQAALLALMSVWMLVLAPRSRARRGFAAMAKQNAGDLHRTIRFFEERICVQAASGETQISYAQVTELLTTRNLHVLRCGGSALLLARGGFVSGDIEAVRERLRRETDISAGE